LLALAEFTVVALVAAAPDTVLMDLWDSPHRLGEITRDRATVFFVCDIDLSVCREGAVFFAARADEIEAHDLQVALILIGEPAEVREFALRTKMDLPVYIDSSGMVSDSLLGEKILPALVLVDRGGQQVKTLYGGGESLEGNISTLIADAGEKGRRWWLVLIPIAIVAAILPFVLS
jgi:peroxiredoxin